ncbi:MAG: polysaccharide deacetylase family protein [Polyangiaceae bacterium]
MSSKPKPARSARSAEIVRAEVPRARVGFYAATAIAFALTARSVLISPVPIWMSLGVSFLYVAFMLGGVFILRWRMYVDAVVHGPDKSRGVVLTFDDGPDPETTPLVLAALAAANAKATFFVIAKKAEKYPKIVEKMIADGHTVGLHAYAHDRLFSLRTPARVKADLERGLDVLEKITGDRTPLFRPPIGHTNPIIARVVDELDLIVVGWSVSARDGTKGQTEDVVLRRVRAGLDHGAIVLMHDASERGDFAPLGPKVLPAVLHAIKEEGLEVVPLETFL